MGLVHNVPPVRSKELPYIDVLSESVNNPIRLATRLVRRWRPVKCLRCRLVDRLPDDRRVLHEREAAGGIPLHRPPWASRGVPQLVPLTYDGEQAASSACSVTSRCFALFAEAACSSSGTTWN